MNSTKDAHELQKRNSRAEQGGLEEMDPRRSTANALHCRCATLINKKSTTVQISGSGYTGPGESENSPRVVKCVPSGVYKWANVYMIK